MNFDFRDTISIWGAILSTILAIDKLKQMLRRVDMLAFWDPETDAIQSQITNISGRPVTITRVELAYGAAPSDAITLATLSENDVHLLDGQLVRYQLTKQVISSARETKQLLLIPHGLLWLRVRLAGFGHAHSAVAIDPHRIGAGTSYPPATPYLAAGIFLGYQAEDVTQVNRKWFGEIYTK